MLSLSEIDRRLVRAHQTSRVVVSLGETIREMISEDPEVTLLRVEKRLRELGSSVHLLAAPLEQMRPGLEARNVDGSLASYWLWICLYPRELESTRERFGIQSPQENLLRLRETGFLMLQDSHG